MRLEYTAEDIAFRDEVRAFIRDRLPADLRRKVEAGLHLGRPEIARWMKIMAEYGWGAPKWPRRHGGAEWTVAQQYIWDEETAGVAPPTFPIGLDMVGPVLIVFGDDWQRERFLGPIMSADEVWCQGYSEPGSGSDLASLSTRAVRDGDDYVVTGTKIWTSKAHYSDWMFALVRTRFDGKKQEGISCLLIDMKSPGITIRPIHILDGTHYFNQVFLDGVRVPARNLVGRENEGWSIAKFLSNHERAGGSAELGAGGKRLADMKRVAAEEPSADRAVLADACFRSAAAATEIEFMATRLTASRMLTARADEDVGNMSSLVKIRGAEVNQRITELACEALGWYALPYSVEAFEHGWNAEPVGPEDANALMACFYERRKMTIWGGSNEIQRNIIAKRHLGL